jgi:hypothetical protein
MHEILSASSFSSQLKWKQRKETKGCSVGKNLKSCFLLGPVGGHVKCLPNHRQVE